jgi:tRNA 2-thiocytidine biosynthesis protein TtcA
MPYRSRLEARVAKKATQAIVDFGLIQDKDRILVGLSGGKDSWALMQILNVLRQRAKIRFDVFGVVVHPGYPGYRDDLISTACLTRGWDCRVERTSIGRVIEDLLDPTAKPCALCARLRRGVLYRVAGEVGATKIALGHCADDLIETLLLNLLFDGALKAMPARLVSDNGGHVVIRPLVYLTEQETGAYAAECGFPIVDSPCPVRGTANLQRQRVKRLLLDLERESPGVKRSMVRALRNVVPSHLLGRPAGPAGGGEAVGDGQAWTPDEFEPDAGQPEEAGTPGAPRIPATRGMDSA